MYVSHRIVKLSSPNLNYFIIAGALLMYVSVYFHFLPDRSMGGKIAQVRCVVSNVVLLYRLTIKFFLKHTVRTLAVHYWVFSYLWSSTIKDVEDFQDI